jgi:hypothetical protein
MNNNNLPSEYKPLNKLTVCSNTLTGGGNLVSIGGDFPLLIGKGKKPKVWLKAIANSKTNEFVSIVENSISMHSAVKIISNKNLLQVMISGELILSVQAISNNTMIVEKLDLRPIGLNLYGNSSSLKVGSSTYSRNSMSGGGTLIGFGA